MKYTIKYFKYTIKYVKCDRCGKVFEEADQKTVMWMKCQSLNEKKHLSEGDKDYHFCLECEKSFIDWFFSATLKNKATVGERLNEELQTYVNDTLNIEHRMPMTKLTPEQCRNCPTHPNNGGDGICHCPFGN